MHYNQGEVALRAMLREEGLDGSVPDFLATWDTYKRFTDIPIVEELPTRDSVSFAAVHREDFASGSASTPVSYDFTLVRSMSRAYSPDRGEDEYGDQVETVEELFVCFQFSPQPESEEFEIDSWNFPTLTEFFLAVEGTTAFQMAARLQPIAFEVAQSTLY